MQQGLIAADVVEVVPSPMDPFSIGAGQSADAASSAGFREFAELRRIVAKELQNVMGELAAQHQALLKQHEQLLQWQAQQMKPTGRFAGVTSQKEFLDCEDPKLQQEGAAQRQNPSGLTNIMQGVPPAQFVSEHEMSDSDSDRAPSKQNMSCDDIDEVEGPPKQKRAGELDDLERRMHMEQARAILDKDHVGEFLLEAGVSEGLSNVLAATHGPISIFVRSVMFKTFIALAILCNSAFIAAQTQHTMAHMSDTSYKSLYVAVDAVFCVIFLAELILRISTDRAAFVIIPSERGWNMFDTFLVACSLFEQFVLVINADNDNIAINAVRALRVGRVLRVLRFFKGLRTMLSELVSSMMALVSLFVLFTIILFIAGTAVMQALVSFYKSDKAVHMDPSTRDSLEGWFGTLPLATLTLFKAVTGGIDWEEIELALEQVSVLYAGLFVTYVFFTLFGIFNLATGVFAERASSSAVRTRSVMVNQELEQRRAYGEEIRKLFKGADADKTGEIDLQELESLLHNPIMEAYFRSLDLHVEDARALFRLLDWDHSGSIDVDEFVTGCERIKGSAKGVELALLSFNHKRLMRKFERFCMFTEGHFMKVDRAMGLNSGKATYAKSKQKRKSFDLS